MPPHRPAGAVPQTSRNIASWRALEQESPDKLFHDPLAAIFAGPAALRRARGMSAPPPLYLRAWRRITGHPFSEEELLRGSLLRNRFAIRTAWFDAAVIEAVTPPRGATQVVLLGAGMDSRAWRLTFPQDVHWCAPLRLPPAPSPCPLHARARTRLPRCAPHPSPCLPPGSKWTTPPCSTQRPASSAAPMRIWVPSAPRRGSRGCHSVHSRTISARPTLPRSRGCSR